MTSQTTPSFSVRVSGSGAGGKTTRRCPLPNINFSTRTNPTSASPRIPTTMTMIPSTAFSSPSSPNRRV